MSNKDRATDTFRLTLETQPGVFNEATARAQIVSGVEGIKSANLEAVCPVCGDPFTEAGRIGYGQPIDVDDATGVCIGKKGEHDDKVGGLCWLYTHAESQI